MPQKLTKENNICIQYNNTGTGMSDLGPMLDRLTPNGTNQGLCKK